MGGEKMSKSLGNVLSIPAVLQRVRPAELRYYLGSAHYRSMLEFTETALHDAANVARVVPTAMVFVPCKDGISHNEIEDAKPEHLAAGADVLLHAMLDVAGIARIEPA